MSSLQQEKICGGITYQNPIPTELARKIPARSLAYVGDSVFELEMRIRHLFEYMDDGGKLHSSVVNIVCAENQAYYFDRLMEEVDENEQAMLKTWRNAKMPRKSLTMHRTSYARSTAVEAWVGFLFLTGQHERITKFVQRIFDASQTPAPETVPE